MMTDSYFVHSKLVRRPAYPYHNHADALRRYINVAHGLQLKHYYDLHKYSVENDTFWLDLWKYLGIIYSVAPDKILQEGRMKEIPIWFPGAKLNYAENLLHCNDDAIALTCARESGEVLHVSYRKLRHMVRELAAAMKVNGLATGDRVAAIVTNHLHAAVIALATASVGAIFSSTATDMGIQGILDRYSQIQPKLVFSESEIVWQGKTTNLLPRVAQIAQDLASKGLEKLILLPSSTTGKEVAAPHITKSLSYSTFIATGDGRELHFEQLSFAHPLFILYSSGTSGPPKCIVHSAGGVLLRVKEELRIHWGLSRDAVYFQYTTTGWMMWPYMLTGLSCGARIVMYDGSPFYPDVRNFLKFLSDQGVSLFGTSPRFLSEVQGSGVEPKSVGSFDALSTMSCTGAVLTPQLFEWAQNAFGPDIHIGSASGGTDICAGILTAVPSLPTYAGELQGPVLGLKVQVFDNDGNNIEDSGTPGELVVTRPHPSLPIGFWGDDSGERLRKAYFEKYPGVWHQGDFLVKNPQTQGYIMLGRSDGVLNPSGVRFGSGEIYSVLEQFSVQLDDSLCVGQRRPEDANERVLLFLKLRPGYAFTDALASDIRMAIRKALSPRHVPAYIFPIEEIPYTVNGKKIEITVKQIVSGSTLKPSGTVANPDSLKLYHKYRHLERLFGNSADAKSKSKL